MAQTFISYPRGSGGNHLRNLILVASNYASDITNSQNILDQYLVNDLPMVHGRDLGSRPGGQFNQFKLHRGLLNPSEGWLYYGHFGEFFSLKDAIIPIKDKKFILIGPDTDQCRSLWKDRVDRMHSPDMVPSHGYYLGEQVHLYQHWIYVDVLKTHKHNVMNISICNWFVQDISNILTRIEKFLQIAFDHDLCNKLHSIWISRNLELADSDQL
jgi:hypothetical protein